ncbi:MAG: sigma-54 dependent transcriptional regulator [Balneolales bacterium]
MSAKKIFIIDDDIIILDYMKERLSTDGYRVESYRSALYAMDMISKDPPDLVITDVKMDQMMGDEILERVKKHDPAIGVIMVTGFGNIGHSVNAMKNGAFDYITKPFSGQEFMQRVEQFFSHKSRREGIVSQVDLQKDDQDLKRLSKKKVQLGPTDQMVGETSQVIHLKEILKQIAPTSAPVLIEGESGTGKEVYANLIQQNSERVNKPFIKINCANLPSELVESTLFGHVKGSFTGAIGDQEGAFRKANGGTLLLDEITETGVNVQAKLLRVLQEKEFQKIGSQESFKADVRIIATTNRNPADAIRDGLFRQDLYFRLNVFPIRIPALRERKDDIPKLAQHFCNKYTREYQILDKRISEPLKLHLLSKRWSGNIRELENFINRGVVMSKKSKELKIEHCENSLFNNMDENLTNGTNHDLKVMPIEEMEILMIKKALEQTKGNQKEAARLLNVSDRTIRNKLRSLNFPVDEK